MHCYVCVTGYDCVYLGRGGSGGSGGDDDACLRGLAFRVMRYNMIL